MLGGRRDPQTGEGEKIHDKFTFPLVIHMDRFMHQNREKSMLLREYEGRLRATIQEIETELAKYEKFCVRFSRQRRRSSCTFRSQPHSTHVYGVGGHLQGKSTPLDDLLAGTVRFIDNYHEGIMPALKAEPAESGALLASTRDLLLRNLESVRSQMECKALCEPVHPRTKTETCGHGNGDSGPNVGSEMDAETGVRSYPRVSKRTW